MRFLACVFLLLCFGTFAQRLNKDSLSKSIIAFQKDLNDHYADSIDSPLSPEDRLKFKQHEFFPADLKYCVNAKLVRTPDETPFEMATTTSRKAFYVKYGEVHFKLNGKKLKLNVYQNMDLLNNPEYRDYLFLPYKDLTSGNGSYGGGRFVDLSIPKGDEMIIDFNKSYNPYCAYNHLYSCPIPPKENFLETEVKAGVKAPKD
jgi:uncharacterized protein (DUF1684 family)